MNEIKERKKEGIRKGRNRAGGRRGEKQRGRKCRWEEKRERKKKREVASKTKPAGWCAQHEMESHWLSTPGGDRGTWGTFEIWAVGIGRYPSFYM